jgi:Cu+-exporting ATPase
MVTGDHAGTAQVVARAVGISEVLAEVDPEAKQREVHRRQEQSRQVAFIGDGINDAPALASADVGITFSNATDVAIETADITILRDDLRLVAQAVAFARSSVSVIKQNLSWAFVYNLAAIPLAATGRISPGIAAACMMFSSISVVLNSLRLRRKF